LQFYAVKYLSKIPEKQLTGPLNCIKYFVRLDNKLSNSFLQAGFLVGTAVTPSQRRRNNALARYLK
jgi:hypothetical protein